MIKNYIITAWRNLKRHWKLSLINILGLAVGTASFLLIMVYSFDELNFDTFHQDSENIYRVSMFFAPEGREPYHTAATFSAVGPGLVESMTEVTEFCRIIPMGFGDGGFIQYNGINQTVKNIHYVDSSYFTLFSFDLTQGNPKTVLRDVHTAVVSESVANIYFPNSNAVGKTIKINSIDGMNDYTITGVFRKRQDTHLPADVLVSYSSLINLIGQEYAYAWNWFDYITYIKVTSIADVESLQNKFPAFIDKHGGERRGSKTIKFQLQEIEEIHLESNIHQELSANADLETVLFLIIVAFVILITAWINYINLYTSQMTERIKEVGIRKTLGSGRKQLFTQFILESAMVNLIAFILSVGIIWSSIPTFNQLANAQVNFVRFVNFEFLIVLCIFWIFCTLVTSIYPAVVISSFGVISSLKQKGGNSSTGRLRKILVAGQFAASAGLISWTLIIYGQYDFMNSKELGIDTSQTLVLEASDLHRNSNEHKRKLQLMKAQLISNGLAQEAAYTSDVPGQQVGWRGGTSRLSADIEESSNSICYKMVIGKNYFPMLSARFVAGRNFNSDFDSTRLIINSEAVKLYNFETAEAAIGERVWFYGMDTFEIVGVVDNFFQESLKEDFRPTAYFNIGQELSDLMVKMESNDYKRQLAGIEDIYKTTFPELPFNYYWLDSQLNQRHRSEGTFFKVFKAFTYLTLFISFLGLVSLSFFMVEKRLKEIGIRKVLGSNMLSIMTLIFKDIFILVLLGNLIALPLIIYYGNDWLAGFAFHIAFNWAILVFTLLMTGVFAGLSTLYHVVRAASINPVTVLRSE